MPSIKDIDYYLEDLDLSDDEDSSSEEDPDEILERELEIQENISTEEYLEYWGLFYDSNKLIDYCFRCDEEIPSNKYCRNKPLYCGIRYCKNLPRLSNIPHLNNLNKNVTKKDINWYYLKKNNSNKNIPLNKPQVSSYKDSLKVGL